MSCFAFYLFSLNVVVSCVVFVVWLVGWLGVFD